MCQESCLEYFPHIELSDSVTNRVIVECLMDPDINYLSLLGTWNKDELSVLLPLRLLIHQGVCEALCNSFD